MQELTKRQREVFLLIEKYIADHSFPPTIREVAEAIGVTVKGAHDHINALIKKGWIRRSAHQSRSLELLVRTDKPESKPEMLEIPLLGSVAAGSPLLAEENREGSLSLPSSLLGKGEFFALRVRGDSMIDEGIHDGDIAIILSQNTARNGEVVVALLDDSATLKYFYRESNRVRLQAANENYPPIYTQNVRVLGRLAHLIRSYV